MEIIKLHRHQSIAAIAHKHQLGDLMVTYRPVHWIIFYVITGVLLASWGYDEIRSGSGQSILLGVGLLTGAMALIYRIYADSWSFFELGILRRHGRRLKLIDYSEVSEFWADIAQVVILWFGVIPTKGRRRERYKLCFAPHTHEIPLNLPAFSYIKLLQTAMARSHLPLRLEAYQAGEDIHFGNVIINQSGMSIIRQGFLGNKVKETLSWSRFGAIELSRGHFNIYDHSSTKVWMSTTCAKIPNLHVLLTLLTQHIGINVRKT